MNKTISRLVLVFAMVAILAGGFAAFGVKEARAADGTFNISVYHGINGNTLGLSKELPVVATVWKDGVPLANLPLSFKDRFTTDLPAGTYTITVALPDGTPLPSMTVGPVAIPADVDVRIQAQLSGGKTPILNARVK